MKAARRHRRQTAWIALFAMLAFALVPTLSRAMSVAGSGSAWAEVCTPRGVVVVAPGAVDQAPLQAVGHQLDHCAFCSLASDGSAPWPSLPPSLRLPPAGAEVLPWAPQPVHRPFAACSAPARAPPARP